MAKQNCPDERVVYLKLKDIFKGPQAEVRQPKIINKLIKKNEKQGDIAELIRAHNFDVICNTARSLLTEQIFESTLKAKIRFPELFDVSPAQSAERAASEAQAARNDADAIRDLGKQPSLEVSLASLDAGESVEKSSVATLKAPSPVRVKRSHNTPWLFPVYLPLRTQHHLLVRIQTILESACFRFGQQHMPEIIDKNGWDCPESAELNLWAAEFMKRQDEFKDKENLSGKSTDKLFRSMADIRHAAVHRIRMSAKGLQLFIADAESFAILLEDAECQSSLTSLRQKTQLAVEELERTKHILQAKLEDTLKSIAMQRAELDRLEEQSVNEIIKEDEAYRTFAGWNLEESILIGPRTTAPASVPDVEGQASLAGTESGDD